MPVPPDTLTPGEQNPDSGSTSMPYIPERPPAVEQYVYHHSEAAASYSKLSPLWRWKSPTMRH